MVADSNGFPCRATSGLTDTNVHQVPSDVAGARYATRVGAAICFT